MLKKQPFLFSISTYILPSKGEHTIVFSDYVEKINTKGRSDRRILIITEKAMYQCLPNKERTCRRRLLGTNFLQASISAYAANLVALHHTSGYGMYCDNLGSLFLDLLS